MICCDYVRITASRENCWSLSGQTSQALCQDVQNELIKEAQKTAQNESDNSQELRFLEKGGWCMVHCCLSGCKLLRQEVSYDLVLGPLKDSVRVTEKVGAVGQTAGVGEFAAV